ncbi:MAG: radical SAM protein, partial [Acidobacteriota bacterium]
MTFYDEIKRYDWARVEQAIHSRTEDDVRRALFSARPDMDDLMSLLSPAAEVFIEEMAQRAHAITQQRFGKTISLFAPLYVSNVCTNRCVYCGFNAGNSIERLTLTPEEAEKEAKFIHDMGFRNILLVSGEAPKLVDTAYFVDIVKRLRSMFPSISVEIYPMPVEGYKELGDSGVDGLVVFQETYNEELYGSLHPAGRKRDYRWRLETPDRGGEAGLRRLGLGALLGLCDWRTESFFLVLHARYLMKKFWRSFVSISFPRMRPAAGGFQPNVVVS